MLGVLFALGASFSWGFGDFFIQRATRKLGDINTLLAIGLAGAVGLFPFVVSELPAFFSDRRHLILLAVTGVVTFFAALFDFEALKRGKIAIVEPVIAFELPIAIALSAVFLGERLTPVQLMLCGTTFCGIVLGVTQHHTHLHYHKRIFERGVILAGVGAVVMGAVNFLVGASSQATSPMLTIWFSGLVFSFMCVVYLVSRSELGAFVSNLRVAPLVILTVMVLDNAAWLFFAVAVKHIPVGIATTISESYIALAVILGLYVNRERIQRHQLIGVGVTVASVVALALVTSGQF